MTVQAATSALAPAAVTTRVIAYIIDAIILGLLGIILLGAVITDLTIVGNVTRAIIYAVLGFLYFGYTWTAWRASPGQRILGLMTVNAADGAALTWNQATMRWAFLFGPSVLNSLFPVGGGLGAVVSLVIVGLGALGGLLRRRHVLAKLENVLLSCDAGDFLNLRAAGEQHNDSEEEDGSPPRGWG